MIYRWCISKLHWISWCNDMVRGRVQHDRLESIIRDVDLGISIFHGHRQDRLSPRYWCQRPPNLTPGRSRSQKYRLFVLPLCRSSDQSTAMNIATQCVSQLQIDSISIALTPPNLTGRSGSQKYTLFCSPLLPPEWSIHRNDHCNSVCEPVCSAVTPPHPAYPSCHQCTWQQLHDNLHDNSFSYAKLSHLRGTLLLNK